MHKSSEYSSGDWVVHAIYGVGKITKVETKGISGQETRYYRVEATNSTYWMPVEQMDSDLIRHIASEAEMEDVIQILQREPKEMSSNHKTRKSTIRRTRLSNTPAAFARLIRDLKARQSVKGTLNVKEKSAFKAIKKRLAEEWAIVRGTRTERAANRIDNILKRQEPLTE
jgi:RNA polymerase-interacting CarD/CdnL/TRCF family regulator